MGDGVVERDSGGVGGEKGGWSRVRGQRDGSRGLPTKLQRIEKRSNGCLKNGFQTTTRVYCLHVASDLELLVLLLLLLLLASPRTEPLGIGNPAMGRGRDFLVFGRTMRALCFVFFDDGGERFACF